MLDTPIDSPPVSPSIGAAGAPGEAATLTRQPLLSLVIPARDEAENLPALIEEVERALAGIDYECLIVDDGSTDATWSVLVEHAGLNPRLRPLQHECGAGQSTSIWQAAHVACGLWLATIDGDGQNDPADLPRMLARARQGDVTMVAGHRVTRRDDWLKRLSSRVANRVRSAILGDQTPDTGCGLKVLRREAFLALPYFDHMHRFLPALVKAQGGRCVSVPVGHRPRLAGESHYTLNNRLLVGLVDLVGVLWLRRRSRLPAPLLELDRQSRMRVQASHPVAGRGNEAVSAGPPAEVGVGRGDVMAATAAHDA